MPEPPGLDGASFAPLLGAPELPGKRAAFSITLAGERMVCTERWKLVLHPAGTEPSGLLFDLGNDRLENTNLFDSPEHQAIVGELTALMPVRLKSLTSLPATPSRSSRRRTAP